MLIRTRPASVAISLEARVPTKDRPDPKRESVSFALLPTDERDHLDLDTGEVFQDYDYARLHKNEKKLIPASITIRECLDDTHYQYNAMLYSGEQTGDDFYSRSSIYFDVFITPTAFRELASNVRGGLCPETITIEFQSKYFTSGTNPKERAIEYGWEPDGSGIIWHNREKENQVIAIESVRFDYEVVKPRYGEKLDRLLPIQLNAPEQRISEQMALIQSSLAEMLKYTRWITIGIVALAIMIAILVLKRGALY